MNLRAVLAAAIAVSAFACKGDAKNDNSCTSNLDCTAAGTRCDVVNSRCVCNTDEACPTGQVCNLAGACQERAGCTRNSECLEANTYCNIASGQCLVGPALMLDSECGLASHCPFGSTCQNGRCVEHCYDNGDCPLGVVCHEQRCVAGQDLCNDANFCDYGQLCSNLTSPGMCKDDRRGPYCRGCETRFLPQNPEPCDHPMNFCLINSQERDGFPQICGVDCSLGQACPNGYGCFDVVVLTDATCQVNAECQCDRNSITYPTTTCTAPVECDPRLPNGQPDANARFCYLAGHSACNVGNPGGSAGCIVPRDSTAGFCECGRNEDCGEGGTCVDGLCCTGEVDATRECRGGENRVSGACTCGKDSDCRTEACDGSRGACQITGRPCQPGDNACGQIECIDGGCLIGRNCAPEQGLTCSVLDPND